MNEVKLRTRGGPRLPIVVIAALAGCAAPLASPAGGAEAQAVKPPLPVTAVLAQRQNVALWRDAVGTVTAYYSVTVHPQVDGRLDEVRFTEGQAVKKSEVLAIIDPRPYDIALKNAEAALVRDRATLRNARLNAERYRALRSDKMVSEQQLTDQEALVATSEGTVLADEAQVMQAKLQVDYAHIKAPIAGITGLRLVDPGNVVRAADSNGLLVINQLDPISVLFTLPEDQLPDVLQFMRAHPLLVEAYARDGATLLGRGRLALVDNQINVASGTIRLKAVFDNPDHRLWPNQFVKIRLQLTELLDHSVVPAASIVGTGDKASVFLATPANKARKVNVVVRAMQGDDAILAEPLSAGAMLVVEGQAQLGDGQVVTVRPREPGKKAAPAAASKRAPGAVEQGRDATQKPAAPAQKPSP